jgi:hypothetical protein
MSDPQSGDVPERPKVTRARARTSGPAPAGRTPRGRAKATDETASRVSAAGGPAAAVPGSVPPTAATTPTTTPASPITERPPLVPVGPDRELHDTGLDAVATGTLRIVQGGVSHATATNIDIQQGGIGRAEATDIAVSQGGIGLAQGDRVSLEMGAIGLTLAREARVSQALAQNVFAQGVEIEQSAVWSMAAGKVTFRRGGFVGVLLAREVDGDVKPLLDWRGALAAGAVIGLFLALVRRR